ncbi:MAG: excinuclease ABC subunit A [Verrucomicrobia bacterium]|nr:excinuclease ABC subunit A [Verrucomicrobiota bacterium]
MATDYIRIGGARQHNLKAVTLAIPRGRLVVITGLSGSGKSSLAFDTIYAEGQRKYVESLSAYARQFLDQLQKPDVDYLEGLSPTIAIEQRSSGSNPRSIIATTTEIYDYLRLLFAHVGQPHCPVSGQPISRRTTTDIVDEIASLPTRTRIMLLAPVIEKQKGEFRDVIERLARDGFVRARVDGELVELAANVRIKLDPKQAHTIEVVVDRLVVDEKIRVRLADSVETALKWGGGKLLVLSQAPEASGQLERGGNAVDLQMPSATSVSPSPRKGEGRGEKSVAAMANTLTPSQPAPSPPAAEREKKAAPWTEALLSNRMYSPATGATFDPPEPKHFSFNSPFGACPVCHGLGQKMVFDPALIVPDAEKSLEGGAVIPWRRGGKRMIVYYKALLRGLCAHYEAKMDVPWKSLPEDFRRVIIHGSGDTEVSFHFMRAGKVSKISRPFEGVLKNLERLYTESESEFTRNRLKAFMAPEHCDACGGKRLRPEVLAVTLGGANSSFSSINVPPSKSAHGARLNSESTSTKKFHRKAPGLSIADVCALSVDTADLFFASLPLTEFQRKIAGELVKEIRARLGFLKNVGLGYLTLDRESGTLSGGEAQRIRLATQIGAGLVGVIYILDEPSIGLHQRDNERLLKTLEGLRDLGNSVLVVEHDEDTIRRADHVIDLGPGAGTHGGEVVAQGTVAEVMTNPRSLTGRYLSGDLSIPVPRKRISPVGKAGWLEITGARENNLQNVTARIPLGTLTCVTGVSGSGKSTLVCDILQRHLFRLWFGSKERPGAHRTITGTESLNKVVVIDQTPIGRTPRSNPATYTGIFNAIRDLFAQLPAAKIRGYDAGRFSFNVKGGRCEKCQGDGLLKIEMHFLPPVYVTCEGCAGRRYNRETLEINFKGMNIADVLDLTVDEAVSVFRAVPKIYEPCLTLAEVGLGYLRLGQPATTLSGGEAQRVKLASELSRRQTGRTLYILDEPTTGLHFQDVAKLLEVFFKLRAPGNTLLVIEHNLEVIKCADWILDLGPEGGTGGGRIVAEGTPETVAATPGSHTGEFLNRILGPMTNNASQ